MVNVLIARMATLDKKEAVKLELKTVRPTLVMEDASVVNPNSLSCLMNAGIIIF